MQWSFKVTWDQVLRATARAMKQGIRMIGSSQRHAVQSMLSTISHIVGAEHRSITLPYHQNGLKCLDITVQLAQGPDETAEMLKSTHAQAHIIALALSWNEGMHASAFVGKKLTYPHVRHTPKHSFFVLACTRVIFVVQSIHIFAFAHSDNSLSLWIPREWERHFISVSERKGGFSWRRRWWSSSSNSSNSSENAKCSFCTSALEAGDRIRQLRIRGLRIDIADMPLWWMIISICDYYYCMNVRSSLIVPSFHFRFLIHLFSAAKLLKRFYDVY